MPEFLDIEQILEINNTARPEYASRLVSPVAGRC